MFKNLVFYIKSHSVCFSMLTKCYSKLLQKQIASPDEEVHFRLLVFALFCSLTKVNSFFDKVPSSVWPGSEERNIF